MANGLRGAEDRPSFEGGVFGPYLIEHFNGGLFDHGPLVPLLAEDLDRLHAVMALDWSQIDPAIFGTLFERGLDPAKRSQLGAHYTDAASIQRIIDPVVVEPLGAVCSTPAQTSRRVPSGCKRPAKWALSGQRGWLPPLPMPKRCKRGCAPAVCAAASARPATWPKPRNCATAYSRCWWQPTRKCGASACATG